MSDRLLNAEDLGDLAPYDNGSYVCECPGDYCLVGDCLGKVETLSTVVESIVRREVAKALAEVVIILEDLRDDDEDEPNADYGNGRHDTVERALLGVRQLHAGGQS